MNNWFTDIVFILFGIIACFIGISLVAPQLYYSFFGICLLSFSIYVIIMLIIGIIKFLKRKN